VWQDSHIWNNINKSELHSQKNLDKIKLGECLLPFNFESFVCETWSLTLKGEAEHVVHMVETGNAHKSYLLNLKGRHHSEDLDIDGKIYNIRMDVREIGWEGVDWMHIA